MAFITKPAPFDEAVKKLGNRRPIAARLRSADWQQVPVGLRERAMFSATVDKARFLTDKKSMIDGFLRAETEEVTGPDGIRRAALRTGGRQRFVKVMMEAAHRDGLGDVLPRGTPRTRITDVKSGNRIRLMFETQTRSAYGYGHWKQGQDPDILDAYPGWRFVRGHGVDEPRPDHVQHEGAVRLKSDTRFWIARNNPSFGGFGVPWGPWGYNSGMDVEDVSRAECERLGLLKPDEKIEPPEVDFNRELEASVEGLDPVMIAKLKGQFGDQITVRGDRVLWTADRGRRVTPPKPKPDRTIRRTTPTVDPVIQPEPQPEPEDPEVIAQRDMDKLRGIQVELEQTNQEWKDNYRLFQKAPFDSAEEAFYDRRRRELSEKLESIKKRFRESVEVNPETPAFSVEGIDEIKKAPGFPGAFVAAGIETGIKTFSKLVGNKYLNKKKIRFQSKTARSHYKVGEGTVDMDKVAGPEVVVHELGHAIEDMHPEILERSIRFRNARIKKGHERLLKALQDGKMTHDEYLKRAANYSVRPMSEIYKREFERHEEGFSDGFKEGYAGKLYQHGGKEYASEILSMGLQAMAESPHDFYNDDPEYFEFIYRIIRGLPDNYTGEGISKQRSFGWGL